MAPITPTQVHETLARTILADGFDLVVDLEKSRGCTIHDARQGREFLDCFSYFASAPVGSNHPGVHNPEFIQKIGTVATGKVTNSDIYTVEMAEFVDTFRRLAMPDSMPHAFFVEGGALGVENALKASMDWKVRKNQAKGVAGEHGHQVLHFRDAFHGRTGYTLSLTNTDPVKTDYFTKFDWPRIRNPKLRFPLTDEVLTAVQRAETEAVAQIKAACQERGDDICALIIEPIQGEGGDNHFRQEFFQQLRTLADENDFMLIFDEVQTGVGLTGKMWCHQHFGVEPDMMAFGKKMQVCGFVANDRINEVEENVFRVSSRLNSTWGGNLTDMVRARRYLEIIQEEKLVENADTVGRHFLARLEALEGAFPGKMHNVRGRGLMIAFDAPDAATQKRIFQEAYAQGLLCLMCGDRSIRFRPPLVMTPAEADLAVGRLRAALETL